MGKIKEVRAVFTEEEHSYMIKIKNKIKCKNWHDFILAGATELDINGEEE